MLRRQSRLRGNWSSKKQQRCFTIQQMWSHVYVSHEFFTAQNNRIGNTSQPYRLMSKWKRKRLWWNKVQTLITNVPKNIGSIKIWPAKITSRHIKFCKQNTAMLILLRENLLCKTSTRLKTERGCSHRQMFRYHDEIPYAEDIISLILFNSWKTKRTETAKAESWQQQTQRRFFPVESKIRVLFRPRVGSWHPVQHCVQQPFGYCQARGFYYLQVWYKIINGLATYPILAVSPHLSLWRFHKAEIAKVKHFTLSFSSTLCMHTFNGFVIVTRSLPTKVGTAKLPLLPVSLKNVPALAWKER